MAHGKRGVCVHCSREMMIHARGRCARCYAILRSHEGNPLKNYRAERSKYQEAVKIDMTLDSGEKAVTTFQFCLNYLKNRGYRVQVKKDNKWIVV